MGAICEGEYNYVFVTSTFHIGDLGGIENADQICNERARDAGLPGTYRAYLATSTESPEERLGSSSGWLRPDRRPFVYSRDDLVSSLIRFPLLLDEHGRLSEHVGQGLRIGSTHQNCLDWTSADTSHRVPGGYVGLTVRWNKGALGQRHTEEPLYCFGIDHDAPIPPVSVGGRLAFLTRGAVSPDEGRDAADRLCADEAAAAGLPGSFKALVATFPSIASRWMARPGSAPTEFPSGKRPRTPEIAFPSPPSTWAPTALSSRVRDGS